MHRPAPRHHGHGTSTTTALSIPPTQSPSHIYDTAGTYTVNLTVTNAGGSDSEVKTDYITVTAAGPKTWYVDDSGGADFTTIQAAVNAATDGDTIIVRDGTYPENVVVGKEPDHSIGKRTRCHYSSGWQLGWFHYNSIPCNNPWVHHYRNINGNLF